jgi:hypothetical protein
MNLYEQVVLKHYWPLSKAYNDQYPCACSDPGHSDEGDHWECEHGLWTYITSDADMAHKKPGHTVTQCLGNCAEHPLLYGDILDLHLAMDLGIGWGDLICDQERAALAAETAAERAERVRRRAEEDHARLVALAESEIRKAKSIAQIQRAPMKRMMDKKTGKPLPCKWAHTPAENGWPAGCGKHREHVCPYFHPDEPEWNVIMGKVAWTPAPAWRK